MRSPIPPSLLFGAAALALLPTTDVRAEAPLPLKTVIGCAASSMEKTFGVVPEIKDGANGIGTIVSVQSMRAIVLNNSRIVFKKGEEQIGLSHNFQNYVPTGATTDQGLQSMVSSMAACLAPQAATGPNLVRVNQEPAL